MFLQKTLLFAGSILFCYSAIAQSVDTVSSNKDSLDKVHPLKEVEVRAVRAGAEAPFAKTNITQADIEKQNLGTDLPILLQFTPSAVTTSDAGAGVGYTGLRIRGTDATRINVTMNGIPVNDPDEQGTYFVDIPDIASSAGSIQIQRGVGTSTNGAGAFGATISINNLQTFDSATAIYSGSAGSFNTWKNTISAGTGMLKNGFQFDLRLSKISSNGYIQHSASDMRSMQIVAAWKASDKTWFHFLLLSGIEKTNQAWNGIAQEMLDTARTYNALGYKADGSHYNNQTDNYQQDYYQFFADHLFSQHLTAHLGLFLTGGKGYYEEYRVHDFLSNYGITNALIDSTDLIRQKWLDNYYYGSVFSLMYHKNKTQLTLGGAYTNFDNAHYGIIKWTQNGGAPDNYEWYRNEDQKHDLNIYLKVQQYLGSKLILFAEAQMRNIIWDINGLKSAPAIKPHLNYNFFNPKAGITYLLNNSSARYEKLYASFAVANREPVYGDMEIDSLNLPKYETLYDFEAGYEVTERKWAFGLNLYYMNYNNQLVLTGQLNDVGDYLHTNVEKSYRTGVELQAALTPVSWMKLHGNATLSQNKLGTFSERLFDDTNAVHSIAFTNSNIAYSPNMIATAGITFTPFFDPEKNEKVELSITGKYVGKQYLDNSSDETRILKEYNYWNLLIRYTKNTGPRGQLNVSLAINNLFNQYYSNNGYTWNTINTYNYYYPQAGVNILGGITLKW